MRKPLKISCLCVTRDRFELLRRAIRCYCDQTHPRRELVILEESGTPDRRQIERYLDRLGRPDIRLHFRDRGMSLGAARNLSLDLAAGDVVCQWDDDDCHHPVRLEAQLRHLLDTGARASYLTDNLHWFDDDRSLYWTDWTRGGENRGHWQLMPGSLMMFRDRRFRYPETGSAAHISEDSAFREHLFGSVPIARLSGRGFYYVYVYHGANTWTGDHHRELRQRSYPRSFLEEHAAELRAVLRYYPFPRPFQVRDGDGVAFTVDDGAEPYEKDRG